MKRILLVDDSPSIRHVMSVALEAEGFKVTVAADGIEGLEKLQSEFFDVIVSDVNMPHMNGFEFLKQVQICNKNNAIKLIMLTTESTEDMKLKGRDMGVNVWVVKPFRKEQLVTVINKLTTNGTTLEC